MKIEAGKYYKTRSGKKVYIFGESPFIKDVWIGCLSNGVSLEWNYDGRYSESDNGSDLIEEWQDEPVRPEIPYPYEEGTIIISDRLKMNQLLACVKYLYEREDERV